MENCRILEIPLYIHVWELCPHNCKNCEMLHTVDLTKPYKPYYIKRIKLLHTLILHFREIVRNFIWHKLLSLVLQCLCFVPIRFRVFCFVYSSQGAKFGSGPCMKFRLIVKVHIVSFLQGVQCTLQLTSICFFTDNLFPFEFQNVKSLFESWHSWDCLF